MTQRQALAKFTAALESNYAVCSVVARINPAKTARRFLYVTCDARVIDMMGAYAHALNVDFAAMPQEDPAGKVSYLITGG